MDTPDEDPNPAPLRVWCCGPRPALPESVEPIDDADPSLDELTERIAAGPTPDALVATLDTAAAAALADAADWQALRRDLPIVVLLQAPAGAAADALALRLVDAGVQDAIGPDDAAARSPAALLQRLKLAIARKRIERDARRSWSTDLDTGLPNRAQLLEHLHQLLALRARQPALMALLVLRADPRATPAGPADAESARLLRRKLAVRLRARVRASDVVASLDGDGYAVLLTKIEAPADAGAVAGKLLGALREPVNVLGQPIGVAARAGVALHPGDGADAEALLRQAAERARQQQRRAGEAANE